jgi:hypothetical protein
MCENAGHASGVSFGDFRLARQVLAVMIYITSTCKINHALMTDIQRLQVFYPTTDPSI